GCTCGVLGPREVARLFQSEAVKRLHDPVALLSLGPARQSAGRSVASPMETPEVPVHLKRRHMGDEVERIAHEVSVEDRDGRGSMSNHRMRQCGEVGSL